MVVYTLLYGALAVVEVKLFLTYVAGRRAALRGARDRRPTGRGRPAGFAY